VTNPDALEQSFADPASMEEGMLHSIFLDSFSEVITNLRVSNKDAILGLKEQLEMELRQKAELKFNNLGLKLTKLTIDQLQPV